MTRESLEELQELAEKRIEELEKEKEELEKQKELYKVEEYGLFQAIINAKIEENQLLKLHVLSELLKHLAK